MSNTETVLLVWTVHPNNVQNVACVVAPFLNFASSAHAQRGTCIQKVVCCVCVSV